MFLFLTVAEPLCSLVCFSKKTLEHLWVSGDKKHSVENCANGFQLNGKDGRGGLTGTWSVCYLYSHDSVRRARVVLCCCCGQLLSMRGFPTSQIHVSGAASTALLTVAASVTLLWDWQAPWTWVKIHACLTAIFVHVLKKWEVLKQFESESF